MIQQNRTPEAYTKAINLVDNALAAIELGIFDDGAILNIIHYIVNHQSFDEDDIVDCVTKVINAYFDNSIHGDDNDESEP